MLCAGDVKLGVGINYRSEISKEICKHLDKIDFIEVGTEKFFASQIDNDLSNIIQSIPVVLHGLTLSIGTPEKEIDSVYLDNLNKAVQVTDAKWTSEHIAITCIDDINIRALTPVGFNQKNIEMICDKVKAIKNSIKKPFLLENITYYYLMPEGYLDEVDFIRGIIEQSGCGLLLDINNLYVNSVNHGYDPYLFLNKLPLDKIIEVHLAGCDYIYDMMVDTHASSIKKEVLNLFKFLLKKSPIRGVIIERDDKLTDFNEIIDEVSAVRKIMDKMS